MDMKFFNKTFLKFAFGFLAIIAIGMIAVFFLGSGQDTSTPATPVAEQ